MPVGPAITSIVVEEAGINIQSNTRLIDLKFEEVSALYLLAVKGNVCRKFHPKVLIKIRKVYCHAMESIMAATSEAQRLEWWKKFMLLSYIFFTTHSD